MTPTSAIIPRVGFGFDIHRFAPGRDLILGGVKIAHTAGLDGHSDADVLIHAIMDALLGAAGLKDIGFYFSPSDPQWKNISSIVLLAKVSALLDEGSWSIGNIDCTVVAEEPKIMPFVDEMKSRIGETLKISSEQIGIKATTAEQLGSLGRKEGIVAFSTALVFKKPA